MKVSVILVTYGRARVLPRTLDSILAQSYGDFELIIQDDASPDETESVCHEYARRDSRIIYRRNERNLRMPENLNAGIRLAKGEFIANLHDGDVYAPHLLQRWKDALDHCPDAAFAFNAYRALAPDGGEGSIHREDLPSCFPGSLLLEKFFFRRWQFDSPVHGTVMARRSAYETVGLFDPRFEFFADVDMWMRLASRFHVAYVNEPLIDLPSKDVLPRLFSQEPWHIQRLIEQMFWEGRMRHFWNRPVARNIETVRHHAFSLARRGWIIATLTKRAVLNR